MDPMDAAFGGARWHDHQAAFRFRIDFWFDSQLAGGFQSVEGIHTQVEVIEYQSGRDLYPRQLPGRPKITPVVLKKGYVNTAILWDWIKATMDGKFRFENASIVLMDDSGRSELARYNLVDCWPSRWAGWQLDANSNNAMVEEFELQVRTIDRISAFDKTNLARAATAKATKLAGKIG